MADDHGILEKLPDGVVIHDAADMSIIKANEAFCDLLGYSPAEVRDLAFEDVHLDEPPYTLEAAESRMQSVSGDRPQTFEWLAQTKAGDPLPVEVHLREVTIDGHRRILAVVRDITERRERERDLWESTRLLEAVTDATPSAVFVVDLDERFLLANEYARRVLGVTDERVVGRPVDAFTPEPIAEQFRRDQQRAIDAGETVETEQTVPVDGDPRTFLTLVTPLADEDGSFYATCGIGIDITDQKARERQLQRQNERLEEFANVVSHDLRNPLNVAAGRLELAREDADNEHLEVASRALERTEQLVDDVLTLARAGNAIGEVEPVSLGALAEGCWRNVESGRATLAVETDQVVLADESRLRQLVENLYRNAVEHNGGAVTVTVGDLDDGFYLADDGAGITEDARGRIFEPGFSTEPDGTGFGMSIVREIAHAHDWTVATTESGTGGARFEFTGVRTPT